MKRIHLRSLLLYLSVVLLPLSISARASAAAKEEAPVVHPEVPRISCEDLRAKIEAKEDIVVVDTRDAMTYEDAHIPTAVNIYYNPVDDPTTREMYLVSLPMSKLVVIYCP